MSFDGRYLVFTHPTDPPREVQEPCQSPSLFKLGDLLYHIQTSCWLRHNGRVWASIFRDEPNKEQRAWALLMGQRS